MMFKILHQFDEAKPRRREVGGNYPIFKIHNINKFYKSYLSVSKNDFCMKNMSFPVFPVFPTFPSFPPCPTLQYCNI